MALYNKRFGNKNGAWPRGGLLASLGFGFLLAGAPAAGGSLFLEPYLAQGADAVGQHLFLVNPASYQPKTLDVNLLSTRMQGGSEYQEVQENNGNMTKFEAETSASVMALALVTNFGGGLAAGVAHQQLSFEDKNRAQSRGRTEYLETFAAQYSSGKAVVNLAEGFTVGFLVRFLETEIDLIGSFQANTRDRTQFKSSLFGTGGGIDFSPNKQLHIAAAYLPPMKGKGEVYSEEKLMTEPGLVELAIGNDAKPYRYGMALRRWLYKRDDRVDGTTLNNNNETEISLLGLNVERSRIFPRDELQLGFGFDTSSVSHLSLNVSQHQAEFITNIRDDLPGENSNNETYHYYMAKAFLNITNKNLQFYVGFSKAYKSTEFVRNRNTKVTFSGDHQHFTLGLGAHL